MLRLYVLHPIEGNNTPAVLLLCCNYTEEEASGAAAGHDHAYCCDYGGKS